MAVLNIQQPFPFFILHTSSFIPNPDELEPNSKSDNFIGNG